MKLKSLRREACFSAGGVLVGRSRGFDGLSQYSGKAWSLPMLELFHLSAEWCQRCYSFLYGSRKWNTPFQWIPAVRCLPLYTVLATM
jgi:hypothetical protein